ncbi:glycoside hydrolase family 31 protein [Oculatella sp. LEGE 06141]|uniref:TIM-barrel domain-containing protein n=1 Tax=Oculatella sp. LEGE 06141 TaxID=1828648 RepID=UPI00187DDBB0|nr:glycoside hydrolase family 31 protein [Oculatella sp. LEGE 06141]
MPEFFGQQPAAEQSWSGVEQIVSVERVERGILCDCDGPRLSLSVLAPNLVRVRFAPAGEFMPRRSWAVTPADEEWNSVPFDVNETDDTIVLTTEQVRICIHRNPCRIECFDRADRPFAADTGLHMGWHMGAIAGWKRIEADEHFYGFGEPTGLLDKLADRQTYWNVDSVDYTALTNEMYQTIPFFMALRPEVGYGLFFNTTFRSHFDIGADQPDALRMETQGSELDYYIIYGPEPAQIIHTYTQLTGRMPMPPRWALGYQQCRWSYDSELEVRMLAEEFRKRRIPCDVIHLDIDYMRGYRVFTWAPKRFPEPKTLLKDLSEDGFRVVTIVDPGVKYEPEADYATYDEGIKHNYFVRKIDGKTFYGYVWPDKAVFPDFMRPEVRKWWGHCHKTLTDVGVAGIWNDMNEPSIADRPFGDNGAKITFPLDTPEGPFDERVTHTETHNLYGMMMARAAREGLDHLRSKERSFVLTRSGYAGIQRWSAVWTGDNHSRWEYLEMSLPMLCNLGLSGVAFVGADIGGFAGNATGELFARWMQAGVLYPMMRAHSMMETERHEPWVFGEEVEAICREYIELRYRLLPYIYTLFWEAAQTGAPIMRPLLYHYPNDSTTYQLYDQVFLGPSLMAAPVYRPGVENRVVYFPEGTWYDWWSGDRIEGPTHKIVHAPLEQMPLFAKAGAVIPMAPVMQHVDERPLDEVRVRVWPGTGEFTIYEDDGHSFDYQQGAWAATTYRVSQDGSQTVVEISERQGQWQPPQRKIIVEVVGINEQRFADDGTARRLVF